MQRAWAFDFFYSAPFWAALAVVALLVRLVASRARWRGLVLLVASNALLLAIPSFGPIDLLLVWIVSGVTFACAHLLGRAPPGAGAARRRLVAVGGVVVVLAFLCFFKYHVFQNWTLRVDAGRRDGAREVSRYLFLVGVSYFSFKAIHVIVESYKGAITGLSGLTFFNYMTFFPAFISGPINRYTDFAPQMARDPGSPRADLIAGGERIVHGLFKKLVLAPIVYPYVLTQQARPLAQASLPHLALGLYACALYFFFDFSGYTDLAIGSARLIGFELPENFKRPFFQRNIRDLWSSWHMSLTNWLVDYVYWPVLRKLRHVQALRNRPVMLSILGMNVTFLACGLWHGEAVNFLLWGAYHGLGISVLSVYQVQKRRIRSAWLQRYFRSRTSHVVGSIVTFHFFAAGLALFVLDAGKLGTLLSALLG